MTEGNLGNGLSLPSNFNLAIPAVLSTPHGWVVVDVFVTLLLGVACGLGSVALAGVLTPKPSEARVEGIRAAT